MDKLKVTSFEELLAAHQEVVDGNANWDNYELCDGHATISVRVEGSSWDGRIDVRGAKYIADIQKSVEELFAHYPEELPKKPPLVKASVRSGSNLLNFDFSSVVGKMTDGQVFGVVLAAIAVWGGVNITRAVLDYKKDKNNQNLLSKALDNANEVAKEAINAGIAIDRPFRRYVAQVKKDDTLSVNGSEPAKKRALNKAIRELYPPEDASDVTYYVPCDGQYSLLALNMRQPVPELTLKQGNVETKALIQRLEPSTRKQLFDLFEERLQARKVPFYVKLQADAYYNSRGIKYLTLVGLGEPREELTVYDLEDIPDDVSTEDAILSQVQD